MNVIALIGARAGSERIKDKNIRPLGGHPLLAWTIRAALESGVFSSVWVSSDSAEYRLIAEQYGAKTEWRPFPYNEPLSPDIEWLQHIWTYRLKVREDMNTENTPCYALLRPTSPFRDAATIRRAWDKWQAEVREYPRITSMRAMRKPRTHPYKVWVSKTDPLTSREYVVPMLNEVPRAYNQQTSGLPHWFYAQAGAMEIAWTDNIEQGDMAGNYVIPFTLPKFQDVDINEPEDFEYAEYLIETGRVAWK